MFPVKMSVAKKSSFFIKREMFTNSPSVMADGPGFSSKLSQVKLSQLF